MKKLVSILITLIVAFSVTSTVFSSGYDDPYNEEPYNEVNNSELTGVDYALNEIFTDGRALVSNEVFQETVKKLGLWKPRFTRPNGNTWIMFDVISVGISVNLEEGENPNDITAEELLERNGIKSDYVEGFFNGSKFPNGDDNNYIIGVRFNETAREKFDMDNMSNLDELYLLATLYNSTGKYEGNQGGIVRGQLYSDSGTYYYDVNLDGVFNTKDITTMKRYIVGDITLLNFEASDQNGDGNTNSKDLRVLKKHIANN